MRSYMGCYTTLHSGGYEYTYDERIIIYLYPNTQYDKNEAENAIANGLRDACERVLSNASNVGYYEINLNTDYPNVLSGSGKCDMLGNWGSYYSTYYCGDSTYDSRTGSHMLVTADHSGGCAYVGTPTAFNTSKACLTGTYNGIKELFINTAIQEAYHNFLNQDAINTNDSSLIEDDDHDLGKVYGDCSISPMASGYDDTHARHGNCSPSNAWCGLYKRRPTDCTVAGMDYSAKEA